MRVAFVMLVPVAVTLGQVEPCAPRALRTIDQAIQRAAANDRSGSEALLVRAEAECPASSSVLRRLAQSWRLIGNEQKGSEFDGRLKLVADPPPLHLPQIETAKSPVREKWALLVGVGGFQHRQMPAIPAAARDAADLAALLKDAAVGRFYPDDQHVMLLVNEQATISNVKSALNQIAQSAGENDLVLLYFSTHGTSSDADIAARAEAQTGYIVLYDSDLSNLYGTALPMEDLRHLVMKRLRAKRVVVFLDTCYSGDTVRPGTGGKSLVPVTTAFAGLPQGTGRIVIASSRNTEQSWISREQGNSYFTIALMEALKQEGGMSSIARQFTHVQRTVPVRVRKELGKNQTPVMWPETAGIDIVIGAPVN